MRSRPAAEKPRFKRIVSLLAREYPEPRCALSFEDPLQLIVATVLSAQCTDQRVNEVTKDLFRRYRTARDYTKAPASRLERDIRPTGFYRNKARSIKGLCAAIVERHSGDVPSTMEELVDLPGVGRKTANVVLAEGFGIPGLAVDTHVRRLSGRLGLTEQTDPDKIEKDLTQIVPPPDWNALSLRLIQHGRSVCKARRPLCEECALLRYCPTGLSRV